MLIRSAGPVTLLDTRPEPLLGVLPQASRTDHCITLEGGDTVLFYTDGLVEHRGRDIDEGLDHLIVTASALRLRSLDELCDGLITHVDGHGDDDIALLAVHIAT